MTTGMPTEGQATIFVWLAEKVLGGAKKALGWGWDRLEWTAAQDRYDKRVIKDCSHIRIFGQIEAKPIRDIYTDVFVLDRPTALRRFAPDELHQQLWQQDRGLSLRHTERQPVEAVLKGKDKFFILGKPGAGKTTLLKYLAVREAQRGRWGPCLGKIPIFVPLRQLTDKGQTPLEFIVDEFAVCHFPQAKPFVEKLLRSGQALVLFDGLDEVTDELNPDRQERETTTEALVRFARQYDGCHIAVTCRIAATEYAFPPAFTYLELADFGPDQVDSFVSSWFLDAHNPDQGAKIAAQMLHELSEPERAGIRDLTRNPLLLTLLCLTYEETLHFPARRVEIYREALQALLKKWDSTRLIRRHSIYKMLSADRKEQMFAIVAYDGLVNANILFSQDNLERHLKDYLVHVPEMPATEDIDGEIVLREIVAQHGVFVEQAHRQFSFAHLTFQEYYTARYIVENIGKGTLGMLNEHVADSKWREVFLLTSSLLADGTQFLSLYERTLHNMIASRPRLAVWLRWVNACAAKSEATYGLSATRFYLAVKLIGAYARDQAHQQNVDLYGAFACARALDPLLGSDSELDHDFISQLKMARRLTPEPDYVFALDCARTFARTLDFAFDVNRCGESYRDLPIASIMEHLVNTCETLGLVGLRKTLAALIIPSTVVTRQAWQQFADQLIDAFDDIPQINRLRQLDGAIDRVREESEKQLAALSREDWDLLAAYLLGTVLLFDCLQLAYVPDRQGFEERMLASPL